MYYVNGIAAIDVNAWADAYKNLMPQSFIENYRFDKRPKFGLTSLGASWRASWF
jgi:hypothetical protein